ncbi:hypothetical protein CBL_21276, partial [Carabus blaptoides fortunei]
SVRLEWGVLGHGATRPLTMSVETFSSNSFIKDIITAKHKRNARSESTKNKLKKLKRAKKSAKQVSVIDKSGKNNDTTSDSSEANPRVSEVLTTNKTVNTDTKCANNQTPSESFKDIMNNDTVNEPTYNVPTRNTYNAPEGQPDYDGSVMDEDDNA